jgi:DNA-binding transcriptional LysR family regulator
MGVELRHLAALAAVEEQRSFRGAAEQLGYVQSAVSQQILQLEKLVGARLVDRTRGHAPPVQLTEAGHLLLAHGSRILAQLDAAQADLRTLTGGETQTLRVGVIQSVASRLLPRALVDLRQTDPALVVEVTESGDRDLFARVEAGELDAAFAELPLETGPFEGVELLVDPCVLLVPAGSPEAMAGPPRTLEDLVALPLVRVQGWPMLDLIERQLQAGGLEPAFTLRADANATVQALVGAGCGAAILPRLAVAPDDPAVAVLEVGELLPARRLALYWHTDRRRREALQAFEAAVRRAGAELGGEVPGDAVVHGG